MGVGSWHPIACGRTDCSFDRLKKPFSGTIEQEFLPVCSTKISSPPQVTESSLILTPRSVSPKFPRRLAALNNNLIKAS